MSASSFQRCNLFFPVIPSYFILFALYKKIDITLTNIRYCVLLYSSCHFYRKVWDIKVTWYVKSIHLVKSIFLNVIIVIFDICFVSSHHFLLFNSVQLMQSLKVYQKIIRNYYFCFVLRLVCANCRSSKNKRKLSIPIFQ